MLASQIYSAVIRVPYQAAGREWNVAFLNVNERGVKVTLIEKAAQVVKAILLLIPIVNIIVERCLRTPVAPISAQPILDPIPSPPSSPPESSPSTSAASSSSSSKTRQSRPTFAGIDLAGEIRQCPFRLLSPRAIRMWPEQFRANNPRADVNIGLHASCLLHFGTPAVHLAFDHPPGCGVVRVDHNSDIGAVSISFTDEEYAQRLASSLQALGCMVSCREIDLPPGVIGPECYRSVIEFTRPDDFLFFSRKLCNQSLRQLEQFVEEKRAEHDGPAPVILQSIKERNRRYCEDTSRQVEQIQGHFLARPQKIWGDTVAKSVGAMTSLLAPGYNSLIYAKDGKYLVHVTLDEQAGLSLHFPDCADGKGGFYKIGYAHALRTHQGLQEFHLQTSYEDLRGGLFTHDQLQYSGVVHLKDSMEIVRFLICVCKQTREEVALFVEQMDLQDSNLGREILLQSRKRMEGEEDYDLRIVMEVDREIDIAQLRLNPDKMRVSKIPDLPEDARVINVATDLRAAFHAHIDGIMANNLNDSHTKEQLRRGIENMITVIEGGVYLGVPRDRQEAIIFRKRLQFYLRHVLFLLPFGSPELKQSQIAHLAIGGIACAGRHVQAAFDVINVLRIHCPSAIYQDAEALGSHLSLTDQALIKDLDRLLGGLRKSTVDTLAERYLHQHGGDLSHLKNSILKKIGPDRGIPGAELGDYADPHQACAVDISKEELLHDFDALYNPEEIVKQLHLSLRYGSAEARRDGDAMARAVDFFKHHAPEVYQGDARQLEFIEDEVMELDYSIKKKYIVQMLKITNHLI